ncbi:GNAT family N-acetyltransferase [Pikeienuella piscinae]|uniref:GNAT family N-acetyltransferase n=1 Tax=Pikeienuella piscinae TaxID=2748098 RepID=A0A7M3T5D1_9RHOB|nr:GNAT family protein [Pikeienuella piscinae]QIE57212.1 GNAT family N-acetyltransferase [Pikeienuella piscinae]
MFGVRRETRLPTERLILRPPRLSDFPAWARARRDSREHLKPWEPTWAPDHLTRAAFRQRVHWARKAMRLGRAWPFMIFTKEDGALVGAVTLDHVRRGPAEAATLGYWTALAHARRGYMREALSEVRRFAFDDLRLSRLEAGCLPENAASRALLETVGFKYEGVAQAYLQIDGRWRDHVLYAALRGDRRGRVADAAEMRDT